MYMHVMQSFIVTYSSVRAVAILCMETFLCDLYLHLCLFHMYVSTSRFNIICQHWLCRIHMHTCVSVCSEDERLELSRKCTTLQSLSPNPNIGEYIRTYIHTYVCMYVRMYQRTLWTYVCIYVCLECN